MDGRWRESEIIELRREERRDGTSGVSCMVQSSHGWLQGYSATWTDRFGPSRYGTSHHSQSSRLYLTVRCAGSPHRTPSAAVQKALGNLGIRDVPVDEVAVQDASLVLVPLAMTLLGYLCASH